MSDAQRSKEEIAISILTHNVELLRQDVARMQRRQWSVGQKLIVGSTVLFTAIMVVFDKHNSGAWDAGWTFASAMLLMVLQMIYSVSISREW